MPITVEFDVGKPITVDFTLGSGPAIPLDIAAIPTQMLNDQLTIAQRQKIQLIIPTKTGNVTSRDPFDDGEQQRGRGVDFFTLDDLNKFGIDNAAISDSVGGQNYDGIAGSLVDYMIYHYHNIAFYAVEMPIGNFADAQAMAEASTLYGFADWFALNVKEWTAISNWEKNALLDYPPANISSEVSGSGVWTNNPRPQSTTQGITKRLTAPIASAITKTTATIGHYMARYHYSDPL